MFSGFPWLFLGYSQTTHALGGFAPLIGIYGVSFSIAVISGAFIGMYRDKNIRGKIFALVLIPVLWGSAYGLSYVHWTHPEGKTIKVSLIQGNVPQALKWQPEKVADTLSMYLQLSQQNWNSDLIVWPEGAMTILQQQASEYFKAVSKEAKAHNTTIITGIPVLKNNKYYNAMIVMGDGKGQYLKQHLVPFGEYIPLSSVFGNIVKKLNIPMSELSSGPPHQPNLTAAGLSIGPFICYEIGFPSEVLESLPKAQLLIVITDDSWFGKSIAASQQLQFAQMRARETGRYLLSSTNNGITAIVGPTGKIIKKALPYRREVLTGEVTAMAGSTPFVHIGVYPGLIALFSILILALLFF